MNEQTPGIDPLGSADTSVKDHVRAIGMNEPTRDAEPATTMASDRLSDEEARDRLRCARIQRRLELLDLAGQVALTWVKAICVFAVSVSVLCGAPHDVVALAIDTITASR
jgi:hypothetical protein